MWAGAVSDEEKLDRAETSRVLRRSLQFAGPYRRTIWWAFALVGVSTACVVSGPVFVKMGIDRGVGHGSNTMLEVAVACYFTTVVVGYVVGRLQYNFFDTELYALPSYSGGFLGAKKILNIGAAYDTQSDFSSYTFDAYVDIPTPFGSVQGTVGYTHADGGAYVTALPKEDFFLADFGVYAKSVKVGPWIRYERRNYADAALNGKNEARYWAGIGWFPYGYNFNLKAGWCHVEPNAGITTNQYTLQFQVFYF